MQITIQAWHLWIAAGVLVALAAAIWFWRNRGPQPDLLQATLLKSWTAEQLSTLSPEQMEAVRLWAWAERQDWRTVLYNVQLGSEYPLAKKALSDEVQS